MQLPIKEKWVLLVLSAFFLLIFALSLDFNGIFLDEEYYISVGRFFLSGNSDAIGSQLSVMFGWYVVPSLLASADAAGGILVARFLMSLFAVGTAVVSYLVSKELFRNWKVSAISFVVVASFFPIFFIGRFAVIDMPSVFFSSLSLLLILKASSGRQAAPLVIASSIALFLAFLSKYISVSLFIPLAILLAYRNRKLLPHFLLPYIFLSASYVIYYISDLQALMSTKLAGQSSFSDGGLLMLSVLTPYILLSFFSSRKRDMFAAYLGVIAVVLIQSMLSNHIQALKHVAFAILFLAPFAASGLYNLLSGKFVLKLVGIVVAALLIAMASSSFISETAFLENFYADERNVSQVINSLVSPGDRVLIEGSSYRYYSVLEFQDIATNFYFDYDGDNVSSPQDYQNAVDEGYFAAILLSNIEPSIPADPLSGPYALYYEENQTLPSGIVSLRIYLRNG